MATSTNRPSESPGPLMMSSGPAIAALAADVEVLVHLFEADWQERGIVSQEAASQLHELCEHAQQLMGGQDSA